MSREPRVVRGANAAAARSLSPEVILSGPANSGKTFGLMVLKIHRYCMENPRVRVLMLRKTRESMNETTLETWESEIYPKKPLAKQDLQRSTRKSYSYPNGSRVVLGGMDKPSKIQGARYDIIYVNECTELTEKEWQMCKSRLLSKRGPYRQLIGDCNPPETGKEHWIWKRYQRREVEMHFSDHSMNPAMTEEQKSILESMTGEEERRFNKGSWDALPVGEVFKSEWFQYMEEFPRCQKWVRYWDIASNDSDTSDYTVGVLMGKMHDGRHVIADIVRGRWTPYKRDEMMVLTAKSDATIEAMQFFEKSRGIGFDMVTNVTTAFDEAGCAIWGINPKGSKRFRADPLAKKIESGKCVLVRKGTLDDLTAEDEPDLSKRMDNPWIHPFILEMCNFTGVEERDRGKHDDQVDGASGANIILTRGF